eukprot:TRINITY_DN11908_c0_g2_i1.p1 TRINITY_DN11908_c0_g2~~TRINITY_DN11908_c0_g2_i1.p1  ORF type:complete len:126 (-),score=18.71 TRINITY_DN11908_c0_g2_i1:92-469(-)
MVYKIDPASKVAVLQHLDFREKCGYVREVVPVHLLLPIQGKFIIESCFVYRATPDNTDFLGPVGRYELALHVLKSSGPSGPNIQYVDCLHVALTEKGFKDRHISNLMEEIKKIKERTSELSHLSN